MCVCVYDNQKWNVVVIPIGLKVWDEPDEQEQEQSEWKTSAKVT